MRLPIRCIVQAFLQASQQSVLYLSACCSLIRRPMDSDEESSWHSGMAILEQRSTSRSAGSSARNTEVPAADTSHPQTSKNKPKKKSKSSKTSKRRTRPKSAGSTKDRQQQATRAAHLAAHLVSPHTSTKTTTFKFTSTTPALQHTKHHRWRRRHELARHPDPEHAPRCWSELDIVARVIS